MIELWILLEFIPRGVDSQRLTGQNGRPRCKNDAQEARIYYLSDIYSTDANVSPNNRNALMSPPN